MKKLRRYVDELACILPFEEQYFRRHGVNATFVGHPLFDQLPADRTPPPALYQCSTWDGQDYLTEDETPAQRCAPLQVVGLAGGNVSAARACEQVTDQCSAVPEDQLCTSWRRRVSEAEFRWRFAGSHDGDKRLAYETLAATLANSTCAAP